MLGQDALLQEFEGWKPSNPRYFVISGAEQDESSSNGHRMSIASDDREEPQ